MGQQTIKQQARRTAREVAERRRLVRVEKERRMTDLAEQVMVALGARDQAVAVAEARAGQALREWTEAEGLTLAEMVEWCDGLLTPREATRLRRVADDERNDNQAGDQAGGSPSGQAGGEASALGDAGAAGGAGGRAGRDGGGVSGGTTAG